MSFTHLKLCESLFPLYKQSEMEELHILNKTQEFRPEIVIFVWCNSALAKYMAGVNIETFPICKFTVQIDKQASICTHQKELQKIILFYYSSIYILTYEHIPVKLKSTFLENCTLCN